MKLRSLTIERLPGIRPGFTVEDLGAGVTVVTGPNASGKSSLVRALGAALYPEALRGQPVTVEAVFDTGDGELRAVRQGPSITWTRAGQPVEPPPLPEHRLLACFTLGVESLLGADDPVTGGRATDEEIGARLATELAGGYDVRAIAGAAPFHLKQNHARDEEKALRAAEAKLHEVQGAQAALRRDEAQLAGLRDEAREAAGAGEVARACEKALALVEAESALREKRAARETFPGGMDRLRGDEHDRIAKLEETLREKERDRAQATTDRERAERAIEETGLGDVDLDEATVGDHRKSAERLARIESDLERTRADRARATQALEAARAALGGEPGSEPTLDVATLDRVEEALGAKRQQAAEVASLEAQRARLPEKVEADAGALEEGRRCLTEWLSASGETGPTWPRIVGALLMGIGGLAAAAAAGILLAPIYWLLALPLALGLLLLFAVGRRPTERGPAAERSFAELDLAAPSSWSPGAVRTRLRELDGELKTALAEAERVEHRRTVERQLADAHEKLDAALESLSVLKREIGYDPTLQDAALDRFLRKVLDHDAALAELRALDTAAKTLEQDAEALRKSALDLLARHHETPDAEPTADAILARLDRLATRLRERAEARSAIAQADRDLDRIDKETEATRNEIASMYEAAGVEPSDTRALQDRLDRLDDWRALEREIQSLETIRAERRAGIGGAEDLLALADAGDAASIRTRLEEAQRLASQHEGLVSEIARIEHDLAHAGRDRNLETALAKVTSARDALRDRLDEALYAAAGTSLLDAVEREHVETSQPAALKRARDYFGRFTHHAFELTMDATGASRFAAKETASGERRSLSKLSVGTRMQLRLAVRVAFAVDAERGREPLPFVLDEALTTSDPERFAAAAEALETLAAEGRQVIYLSAQPSDVGLWRRVAPDVAHVDLAKVRLLESAIDDPAAFELPEAPAVPAPDGRSPEAYAAALGVPPIDPYAGAGAIHVFHLLRDDLPLLHRLLELHLDRLGALDGFLAGPDATRLLDDATRAKLRLRVTAAKAWLEAWREGHGLPVDRAALQASGAVSDVFLDQVTDLAVEAHGDARWLLTWLDAGRVKGFYSKKREALEAWLTDNGHLDDRPALSPGDVVRRVAAVISTGPSDAGRALELARALCRNLDAGRAAASDHAEQDVVRALGTSGR